MAGPPLLYWPMPNGFCASGGIGRRARLRAWWALRPVEVRVLSCALRPTARSPPLVHSSGAEVGGQLVGGQLVVGQLVRVAQPFHFALEQFFEFFSLGSMPGIVGQVDLFGSGFVSE